MLMPCNLMLNLAELEIHPSSYNSLGEFQELNFENTFWFADFLNAKQLTDQEINLLNDFNFNTVPAQSYHHSYVNGMYLEVNQLNHGIKGYDMFSFDDVEEFLLSRVEFSNLTEQQCSQMIRLFEQALERFTVEVRKLEANIKNSHAS